MFASMHYLDGTAVFHSQSRSFVLEIFVELIRNVGQIFDVDNSSLLEVFEVDYIKCSSKKSQYGFLVNKPTLAFFGDDSTREANPLFRMLLGLECHVVNSYFVHSYLTVKNIVRIAVEQHPKLEIVTQ